MPEYFDSSPMLIFIDETGDLGLDLGKKGTSSHFVITALVVEGSHDLTIRRAVARTIRNKLNVGKKGKRRPVPELKGSKTDLPVKQYFWRQVQRAPFALYGIVVEKARIPTLFSWDKDRLYNFLARELIDHIPVERAVYRVQFEIDKSKSGHDREDFNKSLEAHIKARIPPTLQLHIHHMPSHESKGIQAADMFSWGIARRYAHNDDSWYACFKDRIVWEEIFLHPKEKKRGAGRGTSK